MDASSSPDNRKIAFWQAVLRFKAKLPLNGDWLFVTGNPASIGETDLGKAPDSPDKLLSEYSGTISLDVAKLIYERTKNHEGFVNDIANRVYDKAKVLTGVSSLAFAILLGLGSTVLPPLVWSGSPWLAGAGIIVAALLITHLIFSLTVAAKAMTREIQVRESSQELLNLGPSDHVEALRRLSAMILTYSATTHSYVRPRVNQLIYAQTALRWAYIYLFLLVVLSTTARLATGDTQAAAAQMAMRETKREIESLRSRQQGLEVRFGRLEADCINSQAELLTRLTDGKNASVDSLNRIGDELARIDRRMENAKMGGPRAPSQ